MSRASRISWISFPALGLSGFGCFSVLDQRDLSGGQESDVAPTRYRFGKAPSENGSTTYYDELHNENLSGDPRDNSKVGEYAVGQLLDGVRGRNSPFADI